MDPYYPVAVHVIDDCDVGVAFPVAGFIHTDATEVLHSDGDIRLNTVVGCFDTVSNTAPVDIFKQGNRRFGHPADHPGDFVAEVFCKTASAVSPGDVFCQHSVNGTFDPLRLITDVNRDAVKIRSAP